MTSKKQGQIKARKKSLSKQSINRNKDSLINLSLDEKISILKRKIKDCEYDLENNNISFEIVDLKIKNFKEQIDNLEKMKGGETNGKENNIAIVNSQEVVD